MSGEMLIVCKQCGEPRVSIKLRDGTDAKIAQMVRNAQGSGESIEFSEERVDITCGCQSNERLSRSRRISIRQILFIMTVIAVFLAVLRHPLQLMIDKEVWQAAIAPWSVYAWLFWGGELVRPPDLKSSPMVAIVFTVSAPAAVLSGFFSGMYILKWIRSMWDRMSEER